MKKIFLTLFVVICLCGMVGLTSCNGKNDSSIESVDNSYVNYTVVVSCNDAVTLATITVKLVDSNGKNATEATELNANNGASFSLPTGTYTVVIDSLIPGLLDTYDIPETILTASSPSALIELKVKGEEEPMPTECSVKLTDPDGNGVANIEILLCTIGGDGTCTPATTNENGIATLTITPGKYEAHIAESSWIEGCFFDNKTQVTVSETNVAGISFEKAVTYHVIVYDPNYSPITGAKITLTSTSFSSRTITVSGLTAEYTDSCGDTCIGTSILAPIGTYQVEYDDCPEDCTYQKTTIEVYYYDGYEYEETAYLFVNIVGESPYYPFNLPLNTPVNATNLNGGTKYYYLLAYNNTAGQYGVTATSDSEFSLEYYVGTSNYVNTYEPIDSDTGTNNKVTIEIAPEYISENNDNKYIIGIIHYGDDPINVTLTAVFEAEIPETVYEEDENFTATEIKTTMPNKPANSHFTFTDINGEEIVYNETDGYYHINDGDGPIVYVTVGGDTYYPRSFDTDFVSACEEAARIGFVRDEKVSKYLYNRYCYENFLKAYKDASDDVGLYPLTTELKDFLQWYAYNGTVPSALGWAREYEDETINPNLYYFACGYYKADYMTASGTGTSEDPYTLYDGTYKLTIPTGTTHFSAMTYRIEEYAVYLSDGNAILYYDDGKNAFGKIEFSGYVDFTIEAESEVEITLTVGQNAEPVRQYVTGEGTYSVHATLEGFTFIFAPTKAGIYKISSTDPNSLLIHYVEMFDYETTYTEFWVDEPYEGEDWQTYTIKCKSFVGESNYIITIEYTPYPSFDEDWEY